jgi:hypothetical protein
MKKITIQYKLIYNKRSRHHAPARFSFHIQGRALTKRRDVDQFAYYVARWAANNIKGNFRVTRHNDVPMFAIYEREAERKFYRHWTSLPESGRRNVFVCTFI